MNDIATISTTTSIALVGAPNCGKTALFNALTGSKQRVANYPGVTVERKSGRLTTPGGHDVHVLDLPGTYSLRARSPDEIVTRDVVIGQHAHEAAPDLLVCVADSTNLRIALRLVLELKRVGRTALLALNMSDIAKHRGFQIDTARLSAELGMPVVTTAAVRRNGVAELLAALDAAIEAGIPKGVASGWTAPDAAGLRTIQNEADRILGVAVTPPAKPDTATSRIDKVLLHPVFGLIILFTVLFLMFQAVFSWAEAPMTLIEDGFSWLAGMIDDVVPDGLLHSFLKDGVILGVGSVIVFLPQILILFLFILLLEDFGYMARAAFLMDRVMGGAGLHGRAFIPLLSSFACAIPGIMATRVIDSKHDRLTTILVAPLMTCSARIPVYTLIIAAFIPDQDVWGVFNMQGLVMFGLYAAGIISALTVSFVLKRLVWRNVNPDPFMLELPDYKLPSVRGVLMGVYQRGKIFLKRAGTTIFAMAVLIWALSSLPRPPEGATDPAIDYSVAAMIGHAVEPVVAPIGFNWQMAVSLVPGMAAREVAVAALGTLYAVETSDDDTTALGSTLAGKWSLATALAFLAWFIFAPQCAATLVTIRRETNSRKWAAVAFFYMIGLAYIAAFITYRTAVAMGAG